MPRAVPFDEIPRRGHLPTRVDLNIICYVEQDDGTWQGWRTHNLVEIPSVIELEADGQPVGYYMECMRCGWSPTPGAY